MQVLVKAFEPEKMLTRVSCCQGRWPAASAVPPQRLTASWPSTQTATDGADFVTLTEVGFEGVADAVEGGGAGAVDGGTRGARSRAS